MATAREFIDEVSDLEKVRSDLANVRRHLLQAEPGALASALNDALPRLQLRALGFRAQTDTILSSPSSQTSSGKLSHAAWESARQLRYELAQVNALARQANEFYAGRIRILSGQDFSLSYNARGAPSACAASASMSERVCQTGPVLHG